MFGVSSRLFKSRWSALLWAAGVIWLAYSFVGDAPAPEEGAVPNGLTNEQVAAIANAF
jgi:hypothetical protein